MPTSRLPGQIERKEEDIKTMNDAHAAQIVAQLVQLNRTLAQISVHLGNLAKTGSQAATTEEAAARRPQALPAHPARTDESPE